MSSYSDIPKSKARQIIITWFVTFSFLSYLHTKEMVCQKRFNNKDEMLLRQKKMPINDNQKHFIMFILQDQGPPSVEEQKRTSPTWIHVISMPVHTRTRTHTHTHTHKYYTEEHCQKSAHKIYKARKAAISQLHSCFSPQNAFDVWISPRLLFTPTQRWSHSAGDMLDEWRKVNMGNYMCIGRGVVRRRG